jgi:hypothetical protein
MNANQQGVSIEMGDLFYYTISTSRMSLLQEAMTRLSGLFYCTVSSNCYKETTTRLCIWLSICLSV